MAQVHFTVNRDLALPARVVFEELIDWKAHEDWVPLTKVEILSGDGGAGTVFVATSGVKPLALPDRMRVDELDSEAMTVRVTKLGPLLTGSVYLSVTEIGELRSRLEWVEDIQVRWLPHFLAKPVGMAAKHGFVISIGKMAKKLGSKT